MYLNQSRHYALVENKTWWTCQGWQVRVVNQGWGMAPHALSQSCGSETGVFSLPPSGI